MIETYLFSRALRRLARDAAAELQARAPHQHDIDAGPCDCDEPPVDIDRWYAAFEKVSGQEATTHNGRSRIYYDFHRELGRLHSEKGDPL